MTTRLVVVTFLVAGCFAPEVRRFDEDAPDAGLTSGGMQVARSVSTLGDFGCAALQNGTIRCWGSNLSGQLGVAPEMRRFAPRPIPVAGLTSVVQVAVGPDFACALDDTGGVKCWGETHSDGDGDESAPYHTAPTPVTGLPAVSKITATQGGVCAIAVGGGLWCWTDRRTNQIAGVGATPSAVANMGAATDVSLFGYSGCAISAGQLYCWGSQIGGHLGDGMDLAAYQLMPTAITGISDTVTGVAVGDRTSCALLASGSISCWGVGNLVGGGPAPNLCSAGSSGTYQCQLAPAAVPNLLNVSAIAAGEFSFCALRSDASIACWGDDTMGALGTGTSAMHTTPTPMMVVDDATALVPNIASPTTCMMRSGGALWCTGAITGYASANTAISSSIPVAWTW